LQTDFEQYEDEIRRGLTEDETFATFAEGKTELETPIPFNICKGKFQHVELMAPALQVLSNMGYIKEAEQKTKGRPTKKLL